jgi:hypothetical protein
MTSFVSHVAQQQGLIPADETVRWSGAPPAGLLFRRSDFVQIPFSLLWCGFAVFWETSVVRLGAPLFMQLWGVPFVIAGVYFVAGRFVWDAYVRARTRYVVTDRAAYVVTGGFRGGTRRIAGDLLCDVSVERNQDGTGTLRFGPAPPPAWRARGMPWDTTPVNGFEAIRDLDAAYAAVLAAQRNGG